jgi:hypothetical protein
VLRQRLNFTMQHALTTKTPLIAFRVLLFACRGL